MAYACGDADCAGSGDGVSANGERDRSDGFTWLLIRHRLLDHAADQRIDITKSPILLFLSKEDYIPLRSQLRFLSISLRHIHKKVRSSWIIAWDPEPQLSQRQ